MRACYHGHAEVVRYFLTRPGISVGGVYQEYSSCESIMHRAVRGGSFACVQMVHCKFRSPVSEWMSALHQAIFFTFNWRYVGALRGSFKLCSSPGSFIICLKIFSIMYFKVQYSTVLYCSSVCVKIIIVLSVFPRNSELGVQCMYEYKLHSYNTIFNLVGVLLEVAQFAHHWLAWHMQLKNWQIIHTIGSI